MQGMKQKQSGFTLLEISVAIVIGTLVSLGATRMVQTRLRNAHLEETIGDARRIAQSVDAYRRRIVSTSVNAATGVYSHTYNDFAAGTNMTVANAAMGTHFPVRSPFGSPYTVASSASSAWVQVQVPFVASPADVDSTVTGTNTLLKVVARQRTGADHAQITRHARSYKRQWYLETGR